MRTLSAAILTLALVFGSSAHSFIPHGHGEEHHHGEASMVWLSIHSSLHHEDKKAIPFSYILSVIGIALLIEFAPVSIGTLRFVDSHTRALRRGVLRYRRFG